MFPSMAPVCQQHPCSLTLGRLSPWKLVHRAGAAQATQWGEVGHKQDLQALQLQPQLQSTRAGRHTSSPAFSMAFLTRVSCFFTSCMTAAVCWRAATACCSRCLQLQCVWHEGCDSGTDVNPSHA